jgi:hypothetical protein
VTEYMLRVYFADGERGGYYAQMKHAALDELASKLAEVSEADEVATP